MLALFTATYLTVTVMCEMLAAGELKGLLSKMGYTKEQVFKF